MIDFEGSVLDRIKEKYRDLFTAEKRVASYILEHPDEVLTMNISELAQKSEAGDATIVRMCKHLGFQGFYQMKLLMSRDQGHAQPVYSHQALNSVSGLCAATAARVAALADALDMDSLLEAARIIRSGRFVYVIAAGNTTTASLDLGFRLGRCGIPCSYTILPEYYLDNINLATSEDVVIAISRSGASIQVLQALELARRKNIRTIVITGNPHMRLIKSADSVITIESGKEKVMDIEPDSHLLEIAVNDILIYIIQHYDSFVASSSSDSKQDYGSDVELLLSEYRL